MDWTGAWVPTTYLALEWVIRLWMLPVVIRRHDTQGALTWLVVIFFQPVVGVFFYFLLGQGPLARQSVREHAAIVDEVESQAWLSRQAEHTVPERDVAPARRDLVRLVERMGHMPLVASNEAQVLDGTQTTLSKLIADIDEAKHTVHLLFFIYRNDETGRAVGEALMRAAARGVRCRVLVDGVGSRAMLRSYASELRQSSVDVRSYLAVRLWRRRLSRIDVRTHRKLVVIDGRIAYTGSQNMANPDYGQVKYGPWRDLSVRLRGPVAHQLQAVFIQDWAFQTGERLDGHELTPVLETPGEERIQSVPSGPGYQDQPFRDLMVKAVYEAEHRVVMTTPYLVPDEQFQLAVRLAALSGVRVDIVVPKRCNKKIVALAAGASYDTLLSAGVNVWLHENGLLHSKTLTVDDSFSVIGSGNLDMRSFSLNFELNLVVMGGKLTREILAAQERYMGESRRLDPKVWGARSTMRRYLEHTAKLFGPLL